MLLLDGALVGDGDIGAEDRGRSELAAAGTLDGMPVKRITDGVAGCTAEYAAKISEVVLAAFAMRR
jgi:hypothetical protein